MWTGSDVVSDRTVSARAAPYRQAATVAIWRRNMNDRRLIPSYELFILAVSLYALATLALEVLVPLEEATRQIPGWADDVVCVMFFFDFLLHLARAERRWRYFVTWGWIDLASSVPTVSILRLGR